MSAESSNSKQMSVEDLLVQDLKANRLGALIGDEDALAKLAKRAIDEALFNPRYETVGSGWDKKEVKKPSAVMEAASEVAQKALTKIMDDMVAQALERPETRKAIQEAITGLFPYMVLRYLDNKAIEMHRLVQNDMMYKLQQAFLSMNDPQTASKLHETHMSVQTQSTQRLV